MDLMGLLRISLAQAKKSAWMGDLAADDFFVS